MTVTKPLSEETMVNMVRNSLLVAGQEMGEDGDHWPVIKATIRDVMMDYENLKIERKVHAEMKKHLYAELAKMDADAKTRDPVVRAEAQKRLAHIRDVYDACFSDVDEEENEDEVVFVETAKPIHVKRAEAIIKTLEEENE